jgi:hypothetical protein
MNKLDIWVIKAQDLTPPQNILKDFSKFYSAPYSRLGLYWGASELNFSLCPNLPPLLGFHSHFFQLYHPIC